MQRRLALLSVAAVFGLFALLLVQGAAPQRWLFELVADDTGSARPLGRQATGARRAPPLRVAIGAMISPERAYTHYGRFFSALAEHRGERLELIQRPTYRDTNDLLRAGDVDLAWICTGAWPELEATAGARLAAVPVMYGEKTYQSFLIAGPTTSATDWRGLAGARFAFTDPLSLSGRLWPLRRLREIGLEADGYFASTLFTHGHDLSIEAVRRGLVDAASVDSLVYRFLADRFPKEVGGLRVLEASPGLPIPPLVVAGGLDRRREQELLRDLFTLSSSEEGAAILRELAVDRLEPAEPAAYRRLP